MRSGLNPFLPDLFAFFGTVIARRMFGGLGLFAGDVMIGIVIKDRNYLKTDENTREAFVAEGAGPFVYAKRTGQEISLSYYEIPDRLYDEPEEFAEWVRRAHEVAERSPSVQRKRQLTRKKTAKRPIRRATKPSILPR